MTFHEHPAGMTVMDGRRCVAVARPFGGYGIRHWMLRVYGGCWLPKRPKTQFGSVAYDLWPVKGKARARRIMRGLARARS